MKKDISDIQECLWHIEDYLTIANHYLHEAKSMLREIEEKKKREDNDFLLVNCSSNSRWELLQEKTMIFYY